MSDNAEERVSVPVTIAGRTYRLNVEKTDEDKVRKAADMINKRVDEYKHDHNYAGMDYLSWVSMVCIQFATTIVSNENDAAYREQYMDKQLDAIDTLLTENIDLPV